MRTERVSFAGHDGGMLAARLDSPDREPRAYALFAHCFTCGKDIAAARRIASRLTESGIAVLRFDFTGLGHSEGEFANTTFSSNVEDLLQAAAWLRAGARGAAASDRPLPGRGGGAGRRRRRAGGARRGLHRRAP